MRMMNGWMRKVEVHLCEDDQRLMNIKDFCDKMMTQLLNINRNRI